MPSGQCCRSHQSCTAAAAGSTCGLGQVIKTSNPRAVATASRSGREVMALAIKGTVRLARRVADQTAPDRYRDRDLKGRRLSQLDTGAGEWPNAECCPALVPTRAPLRPRCVASAHRLGLAREYRMPCRRAGTVADPFANAEMKVKRPSNPDASRPHKIPKDDPSSCWKLLRRACDLNPQSRSSNFSTEPPEQQPDQAEHTGRPQ